MEETPAKIYRLEWSNSSEFSPAIVYHFLRLEDAHHIVECSSSKSQFRIQSILVSSSSNEFKEAVRNVVNANNSCH